MTERPVELRTEIFGVDVHSGDIRGESPTFALVRFNGEIIERDTVSARKLFRLIDDHRPAILAVDNIYELASDRDDLIAFLRQLPDETRFVQVTGDQRPEPLSRVAHRHDVPYDSSPMGEAEASAQLAAAGIGSVVRAFEDATEIRVTRGRSPGKGGSSEDRFTRRIHGSVRRRAREISDLLDDRGIAFEREVTEKYGGWSRAVFTVDEAPADVPISSERGGDIRVEVEPIRSEGIRFEPLTQGRDDVIVGIDPGTNTAVGLVDLSGSALDMWSSRTNDLSDVIEWIIERGRPLIVAGDVASMPTTVEQVRRSFDAVGWTPAVDLPVDEKLHRCREIDVANDHERDAMAAALFAYDDYADQLNRIKDKTPPMLETGAITRLVIGEGLSIEAAIEQLVEQPEPESTAEPTPQNDPNPERRRIATLETQTSRQSEHIASLKEELAERDTRIEELERKLTEARSEQRRAVRREREVTRLQREKNRLERTIDNLEETVAALETKIERMKTLWRLDHSNFADVEERQSDLVPVKPIDKFTIEAMDRADASYGLAPDDVIYLRDASGAGEAAAKRLAMLDPRIVLKSGRFSDVAERILFDHDVPVGSIDEVAMQEVDELAVARESDVEAELSRWREYAADRRLEDKRRLVDELIDEHRSGGRP